MLLSRQNAIVLFAMCVVSACVPTMLARGPDNSDWRVTGNDPGNSRYAELGQIDRQNVKRLAVAWTYHTGEGEQGGQIQATPIIVNGVLYSTSGAGKAFALRAATGIELWKFDPYEGRRPERSVNRGVVYWQSDDGTDRRIFFSAASRLYALDAGTGALKLPFGNRGWIDLRAGLGRDTSDLLVVATSPGVIFRDLLIQGTRVSESDGAAPGDIRAFDVRTGEVRWVFHTIPRPGEMGYDTWPNGAWQTAGGANSWPGLTVDVARGIVFVPTGSAAPDFYGGNRLGANFFANSLVALDASTGRHLWHFQTVHHDILDRDLPAAPNLLTVSRNGQRIDAVAQIAKTGFVFLFDRATGASLFPIEERVVPGSDVPGEEAWPRQPYPQKPLPFARQQLTEADLTDISPDANAAAVARLRILRNEGLYTPPSLRGSVVFPGFDGGGEWGGAAVDRETGVMYVNGSDVPWIAALVPNDVVTAQGSAQRGIADSSRASSRRSPFRLKEYERWRDANGYPAVKPPWGTLNAIDLNTGDYLWRIPLGDTPELHKPGTPPTGTEQYGGPIVTAGGLVFIAATKDEKFRAFDTRTGALLWEVSLPAAGYATPATYSVDGRQYVVVAAGGGKLGTKVSDTYVAFALPK